MFIILNLNLHEYSLNIYHVFISITRQSDAVKYFQVKKST